MVSEKMKKWTKKGIVWTLRFGTVGVLLFLLFVVSTLVCHDGSSLLLSSVHAAWTVSE